jgi:hypothetical protein
VEKSLGGGGSHYVGSDVGLVAEKNIREYWLYKTEFVFNKNFIM